MFFCHTFQHKCYISIACSGNVVIQVLGPFHCNDVRCPECINMLVARNNYQNHMHDIWED